MKVFKLAVGLAAGYVLGSRAGRDKYEQIVAAARKAQSHPAVTQAQQKAKALLGSGSGTGTGTDAGTSDPATSDSQPWASTTPVPRPPRRQPKHTVTTSATTGDPLA